ncbi:TPA: hypothetical protein DIC40_08405 [Patescibacteria group bacterium]|nr:hypothetical protein [Candidatus Gracilibacteria bacterium]
MAIKMLAIGDGYEELHDFFFLQLEDLKICLKDENEQLLLIKYLDGLKEIIIKKMVLNHLE